MKAPTSGRANVCKITAMKGSRERAGVVWTDE
jgi:hypothetical protein